MRRFVRVVAFPLLLMMTLSASDWPYVDEILEDLGSQLQQASTSQDEVRPSSGRQGPSTPAQHALYYQLLLVLQGVLPTKLEIPPVDSVSAAPPESAALFRSAFPEGLYRPPIFASIV
jgi:hypothetical protein